jgi:hypothetical protein
MKTGDDLVRLERGGRKLVFPDAVSKPAWKAATFADGY